jgi:hypothetical protein
MSERILNRDAHTGGGRGTSSFNVCIPVTISPWEGKEQPGRRVLIRFPLPYRVGEAFRPGNGDEKIRCEVGAYAYLQENCPEVPIPRLYGFATSDGETVSFLKCLCRRRADMSGP